MQSIEDALTSITEDRRSAYLFRTHAAAHSLRISPTKFGHWWYRTRDKLMALAADQPGELAAEFAMIFALAESQREIRNPQSAIRNQKGPP